MLLTRATSSKEWVGEYGAQIAVKKRRSEAGVGCLEGYERNTSHGGVKRLYIAKASPTRSSLFDSALATRVLVVKR